MEINLSGPWPSPGSRQGPSLVMCWYWPGHLRPTQIAKLSRVQPASVQLLGQAWALSPSPGQWIIFCLPCVYCENLSRYSNAKMLNISAESYGRATLIKLDFLGMSPEVSSVFKVSFNLTLIPMDDSVYLVWLWHLTLWHTVKCFWSWHSSPSLQCTNMSQHKVK